MDPEVVLNSANRIIDVGVVGAVCLLLMATLAYRERFHQTKDDARDKAWNAQFEALSNKYAAELKEERAKHDTTRDALLEEVRSNAKTIELVTRQMSTQQAAFETLMKVVRKEVA